MRRREFLGVLGGAAAGWPHIARAQQLRRIGVLMNTAATNATGVTNVRAFVRGARAVGLDRIPEHPRRCAMECCRCRTGAGLRSAIDWPPAGRNPVFVHDQSHQPATSDQHGPDRIRAGVRSGRAGLCSESHTPGRQSHRLLAFDLLSAASGSTC